MRDEPSRTAVGSAVLRAAHCREDPPPWVLVDTLSEKLLGEEDLRAVSDEVAGWDPEVRAVFRLSHVVRARLAEDMAVEGISAGRPAYVVLGAGLDTFAWRHPRAGELAVVEIDHPATQRWKRRVLVRCGLSEPANLHFAEVDLAQSSLRSIDLPAVATWSWLGVTMYLGHQTVSDVLGVIGGLQAGTTLVVNFLLAEDELDGPGRLVRSSSLRTVTKAGEPVLSSYTKAECEALLGRAGFSSVELLDAKALTGRYFPGGSELTLPSTTLVAVARV